MKLTPEQKKEIFAGNLPRIANTDDTDTLDDCPWIVGEVVRLSSRVSFVVERIREPKKGGWSLHYTVKDTRDDTRLLRRTPAIHDESFEQIREGFDEHGYPPTFHPGTAEDLKAAEESSYTGAGDRLDAGEAVDRETQDRFCLEGGQDRVRRIADYEKRKRRQPLHQQLEAVLEEARRANVDVTRHANSIEKRIESLRRRVRRDAA